MIEDDMHSGGRLVRPAAMTRRGLLVGAAGLLFTGLVAAAGCGGGGGSDDNNDNGDEGTYRFLSRGTGPSGGDVAVSVTVDASGRVTFWAVLTGASALTDYGQVTLDADGFFEQTISGVRTSGQLQGSRIQGRTEEVGSGGVSFNWTAQLEQRHVQTLPPAFYRGTYQGRTTINGVEFYVLLGVSSDGNATVFGAFDSPSTNDVDYYYYESASFNADGNVEIDDDYFLFLNGDRLELHDPDAGDDVEVDIIFGASASDIGVAAGERVSVRLQPNRLGRAANMPAEALRKNGRDASQRAIGRFADALRAGRAKK